MKITIKTLTKHLLGIWFCLILSGCASIPVSTMLNFSNYDAQQFFAIKAQDVRVRATINNGLGIDLVAATNVAFLVKTANGETRLDLVLEQTQFDTIAANKGLFSDTPEQAVHTLKLSTEGIDNFNRFQQMLKAQGVEKTGFTAGFHHDKPLTNQGYPVYFSLEIKLGATQNFVTLLDQHELPIQNL